MGYGLIELLAPICPWMLRKRYMCCSDSNNNHSSSNIWLKSTPSVILPPDSWS